MAKRASSVQQEGTGGERQAAGEMESRKIDFAEDLGTMLGSARQKASTWLQQRSNLTEQLTKIRDTANDMLSQLSGSGASMAAAVRRGRRGARARIMKTAHGMGMRRGPGRPKGSTNRTRNGVRTVSEETRRKMAEAAKRRWAARKAAGGEKKK